MAHFEATDIQLNITKVKYIYIYMLDLVGLF